MADLNSQSKNPKHKNKSAIRKLFDIFTPRERVQALILFFASLFNAFVQAVGVAAIFPFINVVMNPQAIHENRWLNIIYQLGAFADTDSFILFLGGLVFVTIIASSLVPALIAWAKTRFIFHKNHALSTRLLAFYLSRPYQYFLNKNSSEMGKNVLAETTQLTSGMLMAIFEILVQGIFLVVLIGMLLIVDVRVTIGAMLFLGGGYSLLSLLIKRKLKKSGTERLKANENRYRFANEALSSIKTTRVMGIESYFIENYSRHSFNFAKSNIFATVSGELPRYFLEALAFGGIVFFLVFKLAAGNSIAKLIPLVGLYAFAAYRMMPALHRLYSAGTQIHYYQAILDKIHTDMTEEASAIQTVTSEDETPLETMDQLPFNAGIRLDNVSFRYSDSRENVIKGLTIKIEKNSVIGFAGATGSGKTTLVDILLGLLVPRQGQMLVDGIPVTENNVRAWRRKIGYVPQDIYLSDDTIRKNIAFGVEDDRIDDQQVKLSSRIAALDKFIETQLPNQYDTIIGERGVRLSGGQRQRIGLARAIYRNPEVLVLDEATSSLDGSTEEAVLKAIKQAAEARTVIMIAHRLNTLKDCDQIYIMGEGSFIGQGVYEELIKNNEYFMKMAKVVFPKN